MRYDRVQLLSAPGALGHSGPAGGEALAIAIPSLASGAVIGSFVGLAAGSGKAGVITGVATAAATAAALGLFFYLFRGAIEAD